MREGAWFPVDDPPAELAFDNDEILRFAIQGLRNKVEYALVAFQFLSRHFTMAQLRHVYEVILRRRLDPTNSRRRGAAPGSVAATRHSRSGRRRRRPALYLRAQA